MDWVGELVLEFLVDFVVHFLRLRMFVVLVAICVVAICAAGAVRQHRVYRALPENEQTMEGVRDR